MMMKQKIQTWNIALLGFTVLLTAAAAFPALAADRTAPTLAEINNAKSKIYEIVERNAERIDNFEEVRETLEPFVSLLTQYYDQQEDSLDKKLGAWKQLWTDDADDLRANNSFQKTDRRRTYQVVFPNGLFYNLTEVKTPFGRFSGFLRGEYQQQTDVLTLEFTKIRLKRGNLGEEKDIRQLTLDFEEGKLKNTFKIPFGSDKYTNGPVGAKGTIKTIYIDGDLRIDVGANDADGVMDLFILRRI
jgi:hypothetical protein